MHSRGLGRAGRAISQLNAAGKSASKQANEQTKQVEAHSSRPPGSPRLDALQRRPISTVVADTKIDEKGKVTDAGHIQFQTSDAERQRDPALGRVIGHSRRVDIRGPKAKSFKVSGQTPDGKKFRVNAFKGPAIRSGDDKVIDQSKASLVIDHGEMTDKQIEKMKEIQKAPIFDEYETSGRDLSNCVHAHATVARNVFGWDVQPEQHARPQDLGEQMKPFRVDDKGKGKAADEPSAGTERSHSDSEYSE